MNILHFGKFYPPFKGGMEKYLQELAEQQSLKHNITVLVHNHHFSRFKSETTHETINSVTVVRQKTLKPFLFTPIMLGVGKIINSLLKQNNTQIIHIAWPNPSALFLLMNKSAKKLPWVIQWQSDMVTERSSALLKFAYFFFKPLEKIILKRAAAVIVSSQEYFEHSNALPAFANKCHTIPLGITFQAQNSKQSEQQWADQLWAKSPYKIFSVGRLTFYKNHQLLLQAAQLLPEAQFIITGTGELMTQLKNEIADKQLNNVYLTGKLKQNKLHALMATCDAFCLPSNDRAESYGMVLLEALSFNKSILVSNLEGSGMKWIASQAKNSLTFDCNNANDLVLKIMEITQQPQSPFNFKNSPFLIENCENKIQHIYETILK